MVSFGRFCGLFWTFFVWFVLDIFLGLVGSARSEGGCRRLTSVCHLLLLAAIDNQHVMPM